MKERYYMVTISYINKMKLVVLSTDDCIRSDVGHLLAGYGRIASVGEIKPLDRKPHPKHLQTVLHTSMGKPWVWMSEQVFGKYR